MSHAWQAKYAGMTSSEAKPLKALEDENAKLKQLMAVQIQDRVLLSAIGPRILATGRN